MCKGISQAFQGMDHAGAILPTMITLRRGAPLIVLAAFLITLILLRLTSNTDSWRNLPQAVGLGGGTYEDDLYFEEDVQEMNNASEPTGHRAGTLPPRPTFAPGLPKPNDYKYSRILVMPRMRSEDVEWVAENLPDLQTAIYVADDPDAELHPPKNKGHEVMIYFTYIIDNYENLPDINIFMHSHRYAWHNNELFNSDAVEMIRRLSSERVQRDGYFNMRCHWVPGCPDWMHPGTIDEDASKQEETLIAKSWSEIFPFEPIPLILSQPCCAQFAVSRDRIQSTPKQTYVFYRDWLLRTNINDYLSGRVWEYLWQVVFTGQGSFCPEQSVCYCDGYGLCFGGPDQFEEFYKIRAHKNDLENHLRDWQNKAQRINEAHEEGSLDESAPLEVPEMDKDKELEEEIRRVNEELERRRDEALERGAHPKYRAMEANRTWHVGDGF